MRFVSVHLSDRITLRLAPSCNAGAHLAHASNTPTTEWYLIGHKQVELPIMLVKYIKVVVPVDDKILRSERSHTQADILHAVIHPQDF